ncbi:hypothetical protein M5689_003483 [Euphorbia peplus]|nr:hypothetical protein M5689_003483 [Euphorbia peplus]
MSNFTRLIMDMFEEEEELMMNTAVIAVHQLFQRSHENDETNRGGSVMNHRVLDRNRFEGYERLYRDYFSKNPTFLETFFRRRFRMRGSLFLRIQRAMEEHDRYFVQRTNAVEVCEHERDIRRPDYSYDEVDGTPTIALSRARTIEFLEFVQIHKEIRGKSTHFQLQNDLIEQIWERYGSS